MEATNCGLGLRLIVRGFKISGSGFGVEDLGL